jgi:tRNA (guanine37-N1)-methyltransferase
VSAAPVFEVFTAFPGLVEGFLREGLLAKARARGDLAVHCTDFRTFTSDRHGTLDDAPFGGGPGMVMKPEPVVAALERVTAERGAMHRILLSPSGTRFDQHVARRLAVVPRIGLLCGRYEGFDDRIREHFVDEVLSIGDYVLNGGELAALVIVEAVARLTDGVIGNPGSLVCESFVTDDHGALLEYPQYTRPAEFRGLRVPEVLLSGDHAAIEAFRRRAARSRTQALRPELRSVPALPPDTPIYLAVPSVGASPVEIGRAVSQARVEGLLVLGEDVDARAWAAQQGGRLAFATFPDLAAAASRLRRRHGAAPLLVGLATGREATEAGASGPLLRDLWWSSERGPLVLVAGPSGTPLPVRVALSGLAELAGLVTELRG